MNTKNYAAESGVMKPPEFAWDFRDGLNFQVITPLDTATISAGNFDIETTATLDTSLWPGNGHIYINGRLYIYSAISGSVFTGCYGPKNPRSLVAIAATEIGYQAAPDSLGNLLLQLASAGLVYRASGDTGLDVSVAPFLWKAGTAFIDFAGDTLTLADNATNFIYAWDNAGTIEVEARTDSFANGEAARGTIMELATIFTASGDWGEGDYTDNRLALLATLGASVSDLDDLGDVDLTGTAADKDLLAFRNADGNWYRMSLDFEPKYFSEVNAFGGGKFSRTIHGVSTQQHPLPVLDTQSSPPGGPATGDRYIVGPAATGAWVGLENYIVTYSGASWNASTPPDGCLVFHQAADLFYMFRTNSTVGAGTWTALPATSASVPGTRSIWLPIGNAMLSAGAVANGIAGPQVAFGNAGAVVTATWPVRMPPNWDGSLIVPRVHGYATVAAGIGTTFSIGVKAAIMQDNMAHPPVTFGAASLLAVVPVIGRTYIKTFGGIAPLGVTNAFPATLYFQFYRDSTGGSQWGDVLNVYGLELRYVCNTVSE